jgi:drug/metabolite transporter superfamily protein YnfA
MVSLFARGRIAWILSIVLGVILIIIGAAAPSTFALVAGIVFALFGGVFLVLSLVTKGATD